MVFRVQRLKPEIGHVILIFSTYSARKFTLSTKLIPYVSNFLCYPLKICTDSGISDLKKYLGPFLFEEMRFKPGIENISTSR